MNLTSMLVISYLYPLIVISVAIAFYHNLLPIGVLAASPTFPNKEITDSSRDWIDLNTRNTAIEAPISTDILAVNYYSDGKKLNATLWLSGPFQEQPSEKEVNYGMYIDSDFRDDTGFKGIEYKVEIHWNDQSRNWNRIIESWSHTEQTRVLNNVSNYTGFYEKGGYYILLNVDLDDLLLPQKYKVLFYAETKKQESFKTDLTRWVAIPPLQLGIFPSPSPVELRKGQEKVIEIRVNASEGYEPLVKLSAKSPSNALLLDFKQNDTLNLPSFGVASTPLTIRSTGDALARPYTIFITANSSFPPKEFIKTNESDIRSEQPTDNITAQSSLNIVLNEPLGVTEEIAEFWNKLGSPISFLYGILAGLSPWLYKLIKEKVKRDKSANDDGKAYSAETSRNT